MPVSFAHPGFLMFLLLIPGLVALYFVRSRPVRRVVPSSVLWELTMKRVRDNAFFGRYRNALLLFLQLLVVILASFALARPYRQVAFTGRTIVVMDTSASMGARDGSPDRFEAARRDALELVGRHAGEGDVALVTADRTCRIAVPFGSVPGLLSRTLRELEPRHLAGPALQDLVTLLTGMLHDPVDRVHVFTDQVPPTDLTERIRGPMVTVRMYGKADRNLAVTRLDVLEEGEDRTLAASITNFGAFPARTRVDVSLDGTTIHSEDLHLPGRETRVVRRELETGTSGLYRVSLVGEGEGDLLECDSSAQLVVGRTRLELTVISPEPEDYARLFRSIGIFEVVALTPDQAGERPPDSDLYLLEGYHHPTLATRPAILLGPGPDDATTRAPARPVGPVEKVQWTHPLMKYVSLEGLRIPRVFPLVPEKEDQEILGSSSDPILVARRRGDSRQVLFAFPVHESNLPGRVIFPVLLMNAIRWIAGRELSGGRRHLTGEAFILPPSWSGPAILVGPDGSRREVAPAGDRGIPGDAFAMAGTYRLEGSSGSLMIPVHLESFAESRIEPAGQGEIRSGGRELQAAPRPREIGLELVVAALLLLLCEWALYCRWGGGPEPMLLLEPRLLGLVLGLPLLWIAWWRAGLPISRWGFRVLGGLRTASVLCLVMALAVPVLERPAGAGRRVVIPVIDGSSSVSPEPLGEALEKLEATLRAPTTDPVIVAPVVFGQEALVVEPPGTDPGAVVAGRAFRALRGGTRVGPALTAALGRSRAGDAALVVLLSDGLFEDDPAPALEGLEQAGVEVHTLAIPSVRERGFRMVALRAPAQVYQRDEFAITAVLESDRAGTVSVVFSRAGTPIGEERVRLAPGRTEIEHRLSSPEPGLIPLTARAKPVAIENDFTGNDVAHALVFAQPVPRVLLVAGPGADPRPLVAALQHMEVPVDVVDPATFEERSKELAGHAALIFHDVPRSAVGDPALKRVEAFVRQSGGGFLMIGRRGSFGPGGYADTLIERILPVNLPTVGFSSSSAVVLLLDVSGSMGGGALEAVKMATKILLRDLAGRMVAVAVFADSAWPVVPLTPIGTDFSTIDPRIDGVFAGGGTSYLPGLHLAKDILDGSGAEHRYLLMLSDGEPSDGYHIDAVVDELRRDSGIRLSTVGIGNNLNEWILQNMADAGGGRYYKADHVDEITRIFKEESGRMVKSEPLVREPSSPRLEPGATPLAGFEALAFPTIHEYVGTTLKPRSEPVLKSPAGDPIVAFGRHGLGRTAVFTSDPGAPSCREWPGWEPYPRFWSQLVKSLFRTRDHDYAVRATVSGGRGEITVDALDLEGEYVNFRKLTARVTPPRDGPGAGPVDVDLVQTDSGRYQGGFQAPDDGLYRIQVFEAPQNRRVGQGGVTRDSGRELSGAPADEAALGALADATGGSRLRDPGELAPALARLWPARRVEFTVLWPGLVILGLGLFFVEIVLRRSGVFHDEPGGDTGSEQALTDRVARSYRTQAKDYEDQGAISKAQAAYLKAHSLFLKAGQDDEARRMWERYRILDQARRGAP